MPSLAARWTSACLRRCVKPHLAGLIRFAQRAQALGDRLPRFAALATRPTRLGGLAGEWIDAATNAPVATLFYLHGGGYVVGAPGLYRSVLRGFARQGFTVFAPAYRLAPRHPFPAAMDDAHAAFLALRRDTDGPIVIAGDSAGGGLALALMARLRDEGVALPKAAALFSPWTDLAVTGASTRDNEQRDPLFSRRLVQIGARVYLGRASSKNPLASPLYAELCGLPPLLVQVGADELLRDDSTRVVERALAAGVSAEVRLWPGAPHGWQMATLFMPEARAAQREAAAFLLRHARG